MALIIEDGTAKSDAQSYISAIDFTAYATARGFTLTAATDAAKEAILLRAMDWLEQQPFKGYKHTQAQALQWPRYGVTIDGYVIETNVIPQLLIDAQCEIGVSIDTGTDPLASVERQTKREKVGEIEVEYIDGAYDVVYQKAAETKLRKLIVNGGVGISAVAIRG